MNTSRYLPVSILLNFIESIISLVQGIKISVLQAIDSPCTFSVTKIVSAIQTHTQHRNDLRRLNLLNRHNMYINLSNVIWIKQNNIVCRHCNYANGCIISAKKCKIPPPLLYVNVSSATLNSLWKTTITTIPEFSFRRTVFIDITGYSDIS